MDKTKWFVIGLHLYVYSTEPEVGDMEALKNWKPEKKGIWETLKFRCRTGIWRYACIYEKVQIN